ncbi:MAG TPA: HAMP domain-containing protein [Chromatiales bacterium]|nr:HAMP domain-containing protein [Chromatiales bacterium]
MMFAGGGRRNSGLIPVLILFLLLLISLHLMSTRAEHSAHINQLYTTLLMANFAGMVLLLILIGGQIRRLYRQYKKRSAGFRLTLRVASVFLLLSLVPVSIVYYYSQQFIHRGVDNWIDARTENALESALNLSRSSLDLVKRERLKQTNAMMIELRESIPESGAAIALETLLETYGATELTLISPHTTTPGANAISAYVHVDPSVISPSLPSDEILLQVRKMRHYVGLEPSDTQGLLVRILVTDPIDNSGLLQAVYPVSDHLQTLAESVQNDYARYKELAYLRQPLRDSFTLTLRLILLATVLSAIWMAIYSARRMTAPIRTLAQGTQAIAAGNYDKQLPNTHRKDDLGFLVESFNDMARRISKARGQAELNQQLIEDQHAYLETVLGGLSSGVIAIDAQDRIRTSNVSAETILEATLDKFEDYSILNVATEYPALEHFINAIQTAAVSNKEWREEVSLFGTSGRKVLLCRGTPLRQSQSEPGGYIVVFDDVTALLQAQRDSAWGEVARRLAHEIKNPLTPIQLSAERLQRKFLDKMSDTDTEILQKATGTIIAQVENMKGMVNAFSEYARLPKLERQPTNLNQLINDTLELYRTNSAQVMIETCLDPDLPMVDADPGRLRQVTHNLVKNAIEALSSQSDPQLRVATEALQKPNGRFIEVRFTDNGAGFPEDLLEYAFEPYRTSKPKGTGLGLAIVKKIVEEHAGTIWATNTETGGAEIVMRFPII